MDPSWSQPLTFSKYPTTPRSSASAAPPPPPTSASADPRQSSTRTMPPAMPPSARLVRRPSACLRAENHAPAPSATAARTARNTVPAVAVTDSESPLRKTHATRDRICATSTNVIRRDSSQVQRCSRTARGIPHASPRRTGNAGTDARGSGSSAPTLTSPVAAASGPGTSPSVWPSGGLGAEPGAAPGGAPIETPLPSGGFAGVAPWSPDFPFPLPLAAIERPRYAGNGALVHDARSRTCASSAPCRGSASPGAWRWRW